MAASLGMIGAAHWKPKKDPILVVGDAMLDLYVTGDVARISPEAPVPVLRQKSVKEVLGGAANVAANIVSLGGQAHLVACVGRDPQRHILERLLAAAGVTHDLIETPSRPTTLKTRFMAGQHQLLRLDLENASPLDEQAETAVLGVLEARLEAGGILILSDYRKGLLTDRVLGNALALAGARNALSLVDPKRRDFSVYRGASYIKPNRSELALATGLPVSTDAEVHAAALAVVEQTSAALLITRAERGMSFVARSGEIAHTPTHAREVFDVSGAGDTAMAAFALGLHSGWAQEEAMEFANLAAGVVVSKRGTATVTREELVAEERRLAGNPLERGALMSQRDAVACRQAWARQGLSVGFTNGCFDILHSGHVQLLREAARKCDRLIVALNGDESVRRLKGPSRPVQRDVDRAAVLGGLEAVSMVVIFDEDTPEALVSALMPDCLIKGADYEIDRIAGADIVRAAGGQVLTIPLVPNQSTTKILAKSLHRGNVRGGK